MGKSLYIAEKPSVAKQFAAVMKQNMQQGKGFLESEDTIVTWCVGHLVTMSYPDVYDPALKKWSFGTIPFLPEKFLYEVNPSVADQFKVVSYLLNRPDVDTIYVCTDSGREGEYIYRLVEQQAGVSGKQRKRVWIDSQTEEEILRGIREAKDLSEYDNLAASAYLRAKEDYLMGINFSRALTLQFSRPIQSYLGTDRCVIAVGRVMTCVLGMVVQREREIRQFVKTPFYRLEGNLGIPGEESSFPCEWRVCDSSQYFESPALYNEKGLRKKEDAEILRDKWLQANPPAGTVTETEKKTEKKNAPLLYNLAELQSDCSKMFKISPDQTLQIVQELYEKKLVTYPRTDARVLSSAIAKEIDKNLRGLCGYSPCSDIAKQILAGDSYKKIGNTKYTNDKLITDHYAIIPTGQGLNALNSLNDTASKVYEVIVRRFLSVFYPPAVYKKIGIKTMVGQELYVSSFKVLESEGFLAVKTPSFFKKKENDNAAKSDVGVDKKNEEDEQELTIDSSFLEKLATIKKGSVLDLKDIEIKESETSPPQRYTSGSMILAMESAGKLIEDEDLRAQIKGSGIGTSATRAEILKKLVNNEYLNQNSKTQIITPTRLGEIIYEVVLVSVKPLLSPELTASWEKGLNGVAEGSISEAEYMAKLEDFVRRRTNIVKEISGAAGICVRFDAFKEYYKDEKKSVKKTTYKRGKKDA